MSFITVKEQIEFYKKIRTLVRTGDFYRLQNPYCSNYCSWQIVSKDKSEVFVFAARILNQANFKDENILLEGLMEQAEYYDVDTDECFGGDELMYRGITPEYPNEDFATFVKWYQKI